MSIRNFNEETLTAEVLRRMQNTQNPRLKEVMTSFVKHLHGFVRENPVYARRLDEELRA